MIDLTVIPDSTCACRTCVAMCEQRPCWPLPEEARALIDAGHGDRLMLDFWFADENIMILSPAKVGSEGEAAPFNPLGRCTMLDDAGACQLHAAGLKPLTMMKMTWRKHHDRAGIHVPEGDPQGARVRAPRLSVDRHPIQLFAQEGGPPISHHRARPYPLRFSGWRQLK